MTQVESDSPLSLKDLFEIVASENDEPDETATSPGPKNPMSVEVKDAKVDPKVMREGILQQIPRLLEDIEIPTIIAEAWSKVTELDEYHDQTRHPRGELSLVSMKEHTIRSSYHPTIEVLINGKRIDSVTIDVGVQLELEALVLEIQSARIMAVRPGRFTVSGSVKCGKKEWKVKSRPVTLPGRQALGEGIEIPSTGSPARRGSTASPGSSADSP